MTAAVDAEACAVVATAADIICSLRAADLAGWTPPWRNPAAAPADPSGGDALAWPAVARGKRSRSGSSASASAGGSDAGAKSEKKKKARRARGSPASPLDYSAGSGTSTSGGEDGAFCSPPPPPPVVSSAAVGGGVLHVEPDSKVGHAGGRSILPVPPPRPTGQRPRKKMRLPEIQQVVRSLSVENDALRQEMEALQKACTALSKENGKLETHAGVFVFGGKELHSRRFQQPVVLGKLDSDAAMLWVGLEHQPPCLLTSHAPARGEPSVSLRVGPNPEGVAREVWEMLGQSATAVHVASPPMITTSR